MVDDKPYETVECESFDAFRQKLSGLDDRWVFRGQGNPDWELASTLYRHFGAGSVAAEQQIIREFKAKAPFHLHPSEIPTSHIQWLSLLQHHGAPTRLIDWTRSPYIATFFARQSLNLSGAQRIAIWAADSGSTNKMFHRKFEGMITEKKYKPEQDRVPRLIHELNKKYNETNHYGSKDTPKNDEELNYWFDLTEEKKQIKLLGYIFYHPSIANKRLAAQNALFMINFAPNLPFNEFKFKKSKTILKKFVFPIDENIDRELKAMNITPATLFPDLDGLARSLGAQVIV